MIGNPERRRINMGGRGSFVNISSGDFNFVMGGQQYVSLGMVGDVKIIEKIGNPDQPVSAPLYSHSPNRIYATVKNGELKYLSFYDENHKQIKSIDFDHAHNGVKPPTSISTWITTRIRLGFRLLKAIGR
jgi:hypothetical protein